MSYQKLFEISALVDRIIEYNYNHGVISSYSKKVIPDDYKIEVVFIKNVPIKTISCSVTLRTNTDNA